MKSPPAPSAWTLSHIKVKMDITNLSREEQWEYYKNQISKVKFETKNQLFTKKSELFFKELDDQFSERYIIQKLQVVNNIEIHSGTLGTLSFVTELLNNESLIENIPQLIPFQEKYQFTKDIYGISSLYNFVGNITSLLSFGGAYKQGSKLKPLELIQSVDDFIVEFLPNGYRNYDYYFITESWNGWFSKVAWDYTFLIVNRNRPEVNLILITDSD